MKQLRTIRIILALLFLASSVAAILLGPAAYPVTRIARGSQVLLCSLGASAGASVVWLLFTLMFGRIYCATVCPAGTFSDIFIRLRQAVPRLRRKSAYTPARRVRYHILLLYALCALAGVTAVTLVLEPWNMLTDIVGAASPAVAAAQWKAAGLGAVAGMTVGILMAVILGILAAMRGREFCTSVCPLGTAFGMLSEYAIYHIEINPDKCTSCGQCEEECRASCIKTVSRHIDNSRCVRCFDCVARCPEGAIRFQPNRNRPATPLMRRVKTTSKT